LVLFSLFLSIVVKFLGAIVVSVGEGILAFFQLFYHHGQLDIQTELLRRANLVLAIVVE